jgi:nitrate/nitrite transport system permease protein
MENAIPATQTPAAANRRLLMWPPTLSATMSTDFKAFGLFLLITAVFLGAWELLVRSGSTLPIVPAPTKVLDAGVKALSRAFYEGGVNDVGVGLQLLASLQRVMLGFFLAAPIGLALLKTSEGTAIFVIFISAIWPLLINTIFAVRSVPKEFVDVAKTLKAPTLSVVRSVLLPAAVPGILTGMRVSLGVAWLVIVAAEMLIGGRGIGYSVWNEWNNLSIANIIVDILLIGGVGLCFDRIFGYLIERARYDI